MSKTTLHQLGEFGQSIWLDYISCSLLQSGKLPKMIEGGLLGMTSNPSIFNEAISQSADYDEKISQLAESGKKPFDIYDELTVKDIQDAADIFRPVYDKTKFLDGYVSLEINPKLAMDTNASVKEGKRLFKKVARPNVMIKVPATSAGYKVIEELLAVGINVNVTLIFSVDQYQNTVEAFFRGMNRASEKVFDLSRVRSVASVFVSRIDTAVDALLEEKIAQETDEKLKSRLMSFKGKAAVANSKVIFQNFGMMFSGNMFKSLAKKNCQVQRVLWGSTGTKNPAYSDVKYVTELIARPTVNTLPEKTINAFLDHGIVKEAFNKDNVNDAMDFIRTLRDSGIDVNKICDKLLADGVAAFEKAFDSLLKSIETKAKSLCAKS